MFKTIQIIALAVLCLNFFGTLQAQTDTAKVLNPGDSLPESFWQTTHQIYKDGKTTIQTLEAHRNKLLILDFWATWCKPCIPSLDELNILQKTFPDSLTVLALSPQSAEIQQPFIDKRNWTIAAAINSLSSGVLNEQFPHLGVPHQVWIWKNQVLFITDAMAAKEANIRTVLRGDTPEVFYKKDAVNFDASKPLFAGGNGGDGKSLQYQSIITSYDDSFLGASGALILNPKNGPIVINYPNASIQTLYQMAFGDRGDTFYYHSNRLMVIMNDTLKSKVSADGISNAARREWAKHNSYSYNLVLPPGINKETVFDIVLVDLNRFFEIKYGITAAIEDQLTPCLVLERTDKKDRIKTTGSKEISDWKDGVKIVQNKNFDRFFNGLRFEFRNEKLPMIDHTGYKGNIDIKLNTGGINLERLKDELLQYGLKLTEKSMSIPMLVIRQNGNKLKEEK